MNTSCPTCGSRLTCGCQLRTASNGARVCTLCIGRYEAELAKKKQQNAVAPTNIHATYNPPRT